MAEVWLGRNIHLGSLAAVKFLNDQYASRKDIEERFLNEGRRQGALDHPNIVKVYGFDYAEGRSFLIMQFVDGEPLDVRLQRTGPMTVEQALPIAYGTLQALEFAHSRHIVHRDVKPSNILVDRMGTPYLGDFGIVLAMNEKRLTSTGTVMGTPHYMSPEQIARPMEVDHRSDIYSFGCVLYEMLTGAAPFDHVGGAAGDTDFAVKMAHMQTAPPLPRQRNASIPPAIEQIIMQCLAKDPKYRFSSCAQLAAALKAAVTPGGSLPVPRPKRVWTKVLAAGVLVLGVAAAALWPKQPTVLSFQATPEEVVAGQSTRLSWNVLNAREVEIPGLGMQPPSGSIYVKPEGNTGYRIVGRNRWLQAEYHVLVKVAEGVQIRKYEFTPASVRANEPATLTWEVTGATEVTIGGKQMSHSGSATVRVQETSSYTLRATGKDGTVRQDRRVLEVVGQNRTPAPAAPTVAVFGFTPTFISAGQDSEFRWQINGATKITINGKAVAASGQTRLTKVEKNITANLVAEGPGGTVTRSVTLFVLASSLVRPPQPSGLRVQTFRAQASSTNGGSFFNLYYDVPGATRVNIQPEVGNLTQSKGIVSVFPTQNTRYTLTGYGPNGETTVQTLDVYVTVQTPRPAVGQSWEVNHHHGGERATYCQGTIYVRDGRLIFQSRTSNDGFDVPFSSVVEVKANWATFGNYRAFHIKTSTRNLNFVPRDSVDTVVAQINRAIGQ